MVGAAVMAKKKTTKPGPKPNPEAPSKARTAAVMLRVNPEWKAWAEGLADHTRSSSFVEMIDDALVAYARDKKYPIPPPKR